MSIRPGTNGEILAYKFLESAGWNILKRNFKANGGEIDIVADDPSGSERYLVFVEVKTRKAGSISSPIEAVDIRKQQRIIGCAYAYLAKLGGEEPACRFDVIEVIEHPDGLSTIRHLKAAFGAAE